MGETRSTLTSHQYSQVELEEDKAISIVSADIEFYYFMNTLLKSGEILDTADVQQAYEDIVIANGAENPAISRRNMKRKLVDNVPDIEFCRSPRANEPDRMYSSKTKKAYQRRRSSWNKHGLSLHDCW